MVDLCHLHGIAVAFDVVYNHAGGFGVDNALDDNCLYYMDRVANVGNQNDSLYFTDQDRGTGGLAFALWNQPVSRFLCDNAQAFIQEFHADGFRYDEISTLISCGQGSGWDFCRELTDHNRSTNNRVLQNAEFWKGSQPGIPDSQQPIVAAAAQGGAGSMSCRPMRCAPRCVTPSARLPGSVSRRLDERHRQCAVSSGIRSRVARCHLRRESRSRLCGPRSAHTRAGRQLQRSLLVRTQPHAGGDVDPAYSTRYSAALHGQEFLEDKPWNESPTGPDLLWWDGLNKGLDSAMSDHLRFTQELIRLRRNYSALRGDSVRAFVVR